MRITCDTALLYDCLFSHLSLSLSLSLFMECDSNRYRALHNLSADLGVNTCHSVSQTCFPYFLAGAVSERTKEFHHTSAPDHLIKTNFRTICALVRVVIMCDIQINLNCHV